MSYFMARDSVSPQLTHSSSSELGNVLSWQPLTYHHRGRLPPFPGVSSKGPCLLGSWRPSKLSPISIHSPKLCSMWRSRFRGGFFFFFLPCLLGKNTDLMSVLNQGQAVTLWRALQPISCRVLVSRPGPCGKTRRWTHTHVPLRAVTSVPWQEALKPL